MRAYNCILIFLVISSFTKLLGYDNPYEIYYNKRVALSIINLPSEYDITIDALITASEEYGQDNSLLYANGLINLQNKKGMHANFAVNGINLPIRHFDKQELEKLENLRDKETLQLSWSYHRLGRDVMLMQDVTFDGEPEILFTEYREGQRGADRYQIFMQYEQPNAVTYRLMNTEPYNSFDSYTTVDRHNKRIILELSGGAYTSERRIYRVNKESYHNKVEWYLGKIRGIHLHAIIEQDTGEWIDDPKVDPSKIYRTTYIFKDGQKLLQSREEIGSL